MEENESPRVRSALERLSVVPWLEPDAEMEALHAPALRWIEERYDELVARLPASTVEAFGVPPLRIERSLDAFCTAWERSLHGPWVVHWLQSFAQPRRAATRLRVAAGVGVRVCEAIVRSRSRSAVWQHNLGSVGAPLDRVRDERFPMADPGVYPCILHVRSLASELEERSSPWEPFVLAFERGLWMLPAGSELLVYVPVRDESGALLGCTPPPPAADGARRVLEHPLAADLATTAFVHMAIYGLPTPPRQYVLTEDSSWLTSLPVAQACLSIGVAGGRLEAPAAWDQPFNPLRGNETSAGLAPEQASAPEIDSKKPENR